MMGALALMLAAVSAQSATLTYNFIDGLQGWTALTSTTQSPWNSGGNAWGSTTAGSIYGYDGDDGAHVTYWVRSPEFQLDGSGPLIVHFWGGKANAAAPANATAVPADALSGTGFKGVVLRDVATGNYVKSLSQTADGANADYNLSVAALATYANDGRTYTLDFLDYDYGGWGWVGLDNVTIPGRRMQTTLTAAVPAIVIGGNTIVNVTIPLNFNATAAVTVYVTNSNPSALPFNGSTASVVPFTFAAGAANSQNVPVLGTAYGYASLTVGGGGLLGSSVGITVLPPSGLMGRWLSGAEDLLDKSGYSPAGTHDGMMQSGFAPVFSTDVPPGVTSGSSLDIAASGLAAVMITNTVTTDGAYRPTFDEATAKQLSVVFWAKGTPGQWNPFISKWGEGSTGWQVRQRGNNPAATYTLRGTGADDDPYGGATLINDGGWHHYAATWDGVAGVRKLFVDGKLNVSLARDFGPMALANVNYLTLGGRSDAGSSTPGNVFAGNLFDVQIYGVALSGSAVQDLYTMNAGAILAYADTQVVDLGKTGIVSVSIPAAANASTPVTVYVTNTTPAIVSAAGEVANVVTLAFPAGGVTSQTITLTGLSNGQAVLACAATGLTGASVTVPVHGPQLIGRWFTGTESLTNSSFFTPAGTHDGIEVGGGTVAFATDTPPSKPGKSAQFGGNVGLQINNSGMLDAGYAPTFDRVIAQQFTVAFWAKGLPNQWNPFVTKRGEDDKGWQVRRQGSSANECFTIRGSPGADDPQGSAKIDDAIWHHFTAVWDGYAGTRKCYVDGVLDPNIDLTGDFAPMTLAPYHPLILGARKVDDPFASPGIDGQFTGLLYDVRMYNYPLSATEAKDLAFVAAIKVTPAQRSLAVSQTNVVSIVLPEGANASQQVIVGVTNTTPTLISLSGAVGNVLILTYPVGGSLTQQVGVVGITDGKARLTAGGGGFTVGSATFNVWSDPGSKLIGHWLSGAADLVETSGFRPAGTHDGVAVGANAASLTFSVDVPTIAPTGAQSLDLSFGNVAVMVTNSAAGDGDYVETYDYQMTKKFSITFWAKGTPSGNWNPWISKRGEDGLGYQVRRYSDPSPVRPTFTIRGTSGNDDPDSGVSVDPDNWHHYAATWDGATGVRTLYLDGVRILGVNPDLGSMTPALNDHLMLGARDSGSFGNWFQGLLYDVRVYSYALTSLEVEAMINPPTAFSLSLARTNIALGSTVQLVVTLPAGATATSPVTVYLTNNSPAVISNVGSWTLTFPVGTVSQIINLQAIGLGQIDITGGAAGIGAGGLVTVNMVVTPNLIGHWLSGAADLVEASGHRPAGTHDGYAVGPNAGSLAFANDVPAGFSGQSLDLRAGNVGVAVTNSSDMDGAYLPTFDTEIAEDFTVAFWAKGFPGDWAGWVSKYGENGYGWQLRRFGGNNYACFTVRGLSPSDDGDGSPINVNNTNWHHFAGVWDRLTGTRTLYVDGVLSHVNYNNPSQVVSLAPSQHVGLGARADGGTGFGSYLSGLLYDVRIYDYPMTAAEITAVVTPPPAPPKLTVQRSTGNQLRISWPSSFTGYGIEQSSSLTSGWGTSGLSVTVEGNENVAYAPTSMSPQFFRLKK